MGFADPLNCHYESRLVYLGLKPIRKRRYRQESYFVTQRLKILVYITKYQAFHEQVYCAYESEMSITRRKNSEVSRDMIIDYGI